MVRSLLIIPLVMLTSCVNSHRPPIYTPPPTPPEPIVETDIELSTPKLTNIQPEIIEYE